MTCSSLGGDDCVRMRGRVREHGLRKQGRGRSDLKYLLNLLSPLTPVLSCNTMEELQTRLGDCVVEDVCYRVAHSSEVGRHLVVTRPLRKGEVVFQDRPLVTGPSRESEPCCVSCYRPLNLGTEVDGEMEVETSGLSPLPHILCPRCGWPLCSLECANSERHLPECQLLARAGLQIPPEDTDSLYDVITVIRCLHLKKTDIKAWAALLNLQEANPEGLDKDLLERAKMVTGLLCGTFKIGEDFPKELVFDICTRLDINSFEIPLSGTTATVQGVYSLACMVEHSCIPTGHRSVFPDLQSGDLLLVQTHRDTVLWLVEIMVLHASSHKDTAQGTRSLLVKVFLAFRCVFMVKGAERIYYRRWLQKYNYRFFLSLPT